MPRVDPWSLKAPELKRETRTFTDPAQPGVELTLTLRALDGGELIVAGERGNDYILDYVEGRDDQPPNAIPIPGDTPGEVEAYFPPAGLLRVVALLEGMEVTEPGTEPYTLLAWIGFSKRMPSAWGRITNWLSGFLPDEEDRKNSPGAAGAHSSAPPSASEPLTTP